MASMEYDEAAAALLEAVYLGPDIRAQRQDTMARLDIRPGEAVLDIGSGPGFLAADIAERTGPQGKVVGVDLSEPMIARASSRNHQGHLKYLHADATALPLDDCSFDVVVSVQVAEYVPDIRAFCAEVYRVLRPGGRGLILATDWDAVCWHSNDPARMRRILSAFAPHCADSQLPRTLAARLRATGLAVDGVSCFPIVNLDWHDGCYSQTCVGFIANYVKGQGSVPEQVVDAWAEELRELNQVGEHFFSTVRFSFLISRSD